ncbi:MAG: ferritin-like domain-containing protein [Holophagales bacterium]|nr:MAG: ferritin-like domain-containing protein [Holophagales bacterium]
MAKTKRKELVDGLNEDLAHEYAAIITYRTYASEVKGPWRQELRNFFAAEIPDEMLHAQMLCDKIVALGGDPATVPAPVKQARDERQMLINALADEKATIARYIKRRKQAEALEEFGLVVELDNLIADETKHRDELELMLARWE